MSRLLAPPLALYVHLPWCVRKCPYCDFNSHTLDGQVPEERYVSALLADLDLQLQNAERREVISVFLGGGTPSLFSPAALDRLLGGVRQRLALAADAEITLEANPGTIEHGRFSEYRAAGINRVSLGGQSFVARHLAALGRIHSADETRRAVEELRTAGIDNYNIDLMYGLPDQTVEEAHSDIAAAIALGPAHLSHYQLTLEPGTVFFHRPPSLPDEDACWEMQVNCQAQLAAAGFVQYEVSGYARAGWRCAHNLNYWQFGDYIGIGAGAHGKLTDAERGVIERTSVVRQPRQYLDSFALQALSPATPFALAHPVERDAVEPRQLPFEFMLNALRLLDGFTRPLFESRTGLELESIEARLGAGRERGLLENPTGDLWRATELGFRFLNDLQASFLSSGPSHHSEPVANLR
jgi:putative oxygen-independent coproporphyrinogen III oxidase